MAIFGLKNKKTKKETDDKIQLIKESVTKIGIDRSVGLIKRPRITEKATFQAEKNKVYVFEIHADANKKDIMSSIKSLYKVNPLKVRIAKNPAKRKFVKGRIGRKPGVKKAYVHLREQDKIDIV